MKKRQALAFNVGLNTVFVGEQFRVGHVGNTQPKGFARLTSNVPSQVSPPHPELGRGPVSDKATDGNQNAILPPTRDF